MALSIRVRHAERHTVANCTTSPYPTMPRTLAAPVHSDLSIKKSRFIGCVQPATDRQAAPEIVAA